MYKKPQIHTFRQNSAFSRKTVNKWAWQFVVSSHVLVGAKSERSDWSRPELKKREANRSDVEKERLDTRRDRSGVVRGSKRTQPLSDDANVNPHSNFYRVTLCYSGIRYRRRVSVRLSVCLSITSRRCIKTAKRRITQRTPYDSPWTRILNT